MVKLSIVIPYYKTYDLTIELLNTLIPQLNKEVEVFLIDDECNEKRLDQFKDVINVIHHAKNSGGATACNTGIKKAKGKYIAIIDSDDNISKDYVKTLLKTIDERDEDVIYFDWYDITEKTIVRHPHNYAPWKAIYKKNIIPLFRDNWRYSYDVPFQDDLYNRPHTEYFIDQVLYFYNSGREGSLTLEKEKIRRAEMIKCEVLEEFTLENFGELVDIERKNRAKEGKLFVGDTFKCEPDMAKYLTGNNSYKRPFVKIIEIEQKEETKEEPKFEKKTAKKTTKSKK